MSNEGQVQAKHNQKMKIRYHILVFGFYIYCDLNRDL